MTCARFFFGLCWILLLSACATAPAPPVSSNWVAHQAELTALTHWSAKGKISLRSAEGAESASFQWHQAVENLALQLSGPLGVNATRINIDGQQLTIRSGGETQVWDITADSALYADSGWELPLNALPHWIKGLPDPDQPIQNLQLDQSGGRLMLLNQDDWVIRIDAYGQFEQHVLPTRLAVDNGTTSAIFLIPQWQIGEQP
jgi:outer membrane lipoprotein LolB